MFGDNKCDCLELWSFLLFVCVFFKQGGLSRLIGQQSGYIQRSHYFFCLFNKLGTLAYMVQICMILQAIDTCPKNPVTNCNK